MASDEFVFKGDLATTPLPEMLATVHRYGVPGVLEAIRDGVNKRVFFAEGDVIFATSSDRSESLGDYLVRTGIITEDQNRSSSEEMRKSPGRRHGAVLVQLGYLEPDQLGTAVREQVQAILWSLFNWDRGSVRFRVGRFRDDEVFKIKVPTPRAVLSGCRYITDPKMVTSRLGGREAIFKRPPRPPHLQSLQLEVDEQKLLEIVDGKRTIYELCEKGPMNPGTNARVLYAMSELQIIVPEDDAKSGSGGIRIQVRG